MDIYSSISSSVKSLLIFKKNILFLFIAILPYMAMAQKAKISGSVYDFDNNPLDFVSVHQKNSLNGTFTNGKGKYQISIPIGDSVTISFSYLGYQTAERTIIATGDMSLNIIMREKEKELGEVTILGEKKQSTTMANIDLKDTKLMPDIAGGSVEALIKTQLGVSSNNELSSQYSVRGGNYDENIVYVNGIQIYRPQLIRSGEQEGLSFINPHMTRSVGFSSGGFDAVYGDRMSSALDIRYKTPKKFEASIITSLLGTNLYMGNSIGNFTQITGLRYKTTENLLSTTDTKAEYNPTFIDAQTYLTYTLAKRWEVSFLGNYSNSVYQFTPVSRQTSFGTLTDIKNFNVYFDGWENDKFVTHFGALSLKNKVSEHVELGLMSSAFSSNEQVRYDISGEYELTESNINAGGGEGESGNLIGVGSYHQHARNSLHFTVMNVVHFASIKLDKHLIRWGVTLQREKIDDTIKEWVKRDSSGYSLPNNGEIVSVYSNLRSDYEINSTRYSGYLQETFKFGGENGLFTLNAGIRGSYWSFNDEFIFSPRASIAYIPNKEKDITLRFATGVYYQAPFYREYQQTIYDAKGNGRVELNKGIKSQKSIHFVLGGDYQFKAVDQPFKFTTEIYYKKLSDLVPYTIDNLQLNYVGKNIASGYAMGIDTKLFGEFVPGTDSWVSFSVMKTEQDIDGVRVPLPSDQRFNMSIFFQDYFPGNERLSMSLTGHFSQGLPTSAPNQGYEKGYFRLPAYRRLDIGFSWQLLGEDYAIRNRSSFFGAFKNIWLGMDVFNLFDIKNTNSHYWVTDVFNQQYAVPNFLTGRQLNLKLVADF